LTLDTIQVEADHRVASRQPEVIWRFLSALEESFVERLKRALENICDTVLIDHFSTPYCLEYEIGFPCFFKEEKGWEMSYSEVGGRFYCHTYPAQSIDREEICQFISQQKANFVGHKSYAMIVVDPLGRIGIIVWFEETKRWMHI